MTSSRDPATWLLPELPGDPTGPFHAPVTLTPAGEWALPSLEADDPSAPVMGAVMDGAAGDYARGFAEGLHEGATTARVEADQILELAHSLARRLAEAEREWARDRERYLSGLAIAIARKLVQREIAADPALVGHLVTKALGLFPPTSAVEVRLHPLDLDLLRPELDRLADVGPELAVQWVADPSLERGDCVAESGLRIVDGRTDVALRTLYEQLDD
jgi:flagellar biosynthesis/type III secretory pathway protein FliH